MSNISGVKPQAIQPMPQPQRVGGDADGDNDGTKAATPATPQVSKPTGTMGNNVNMFAQFGPVVPRRFGRSACPGRIFC